jgi:hypothetical protein
LLKAVTRSFEDSLKAFNESVLEGLEKAFEGPLETFLRAF